MTAYHSLTLDVLSDTYAVCRLAPSEPIPAWASAAGEFFCITRTSNELSIICDERQVPKGVRTQKGWKVFVVLGPLDFDLTGVIASLADPLADASISVFTVATYDTDYLMVRSAEFDRAVRVLRDAGHTIGEEGLE